MMTRNGGKNRDQIEFTSLDELVPEDHLVRKLENAIEWSFIYEMVEDSYCEDNGRPSLDPVILIKLPVLQYMFGIRSMRQTIQETYIGVCAITASSAPAAMTKMLPTSSALRFSSRAG